MASPQVRSFQVAAGTVPGRAHVLAGRNNQDALAWRAGDFGVVAVVADGCSSGGFNEVGARLGVELFVERAAAHLASAEGLPAAGPEILELVAEEVIGDLAPLARRLGGSLPQRVESHFLFTLVGVLLLPEGGWLFSVGDGVIGINGVLRSLGPFPGNAPPYLGYRLLGWDVPLQVEALPMEGLSSVLLGTDGVLDLPDLQGLLGDGKVFAHPDLLRRRLTVLSRTARPLMDDTTLIAIRGAPGEA